MRFESGKGTELINYSSLFIPCKDRRNINVLVLFISHPFELYRTRTACNLIAFENATNDENYKSQFFHRTFTNIFFVAKGNCNIHGVIFKYSHTLSTNSTKIKYE